jgi:ketosteroid isomerase-like protein
MQRELKSKSIADGLPRWRKPSENTTMSSPAETTENKALVQTTFDRWHAGTGSPFELLASEADWTIVGSSPLSKTYSRQAFLDEVIHPFNARMATPLVPTVRGLYGDGDMVIVLFDAAATTRALRRCLFDAATTRDGLPYRNTYTWYFRMKDKMVVSAIAFSTRASSTNSGIACPLHSEA